MNPTCKNHIFFSFSAKLAWNNGKWTTSWIAARWAPASRQLAGHPPGGRWLADGTAGHLATSPPRRPTADQPPLGTAGWLAGLAASRLPVPLGGCEAARPSAGRRCLLPFCCLACGLCCQTLCINVRRTTNSIVEISVAISAQAL